MDEHTPGEGGPANTPPFPRIVPDDPPEAVRDGSAGDPPPEPEEEAIRVVAEAVARPVIQEPDIRGRERHYAQAGEKEPVGSASAPSAEEPLPPRTDRDRARSSARRRPGPFHQFADRLEEFADRIDHVVDEQLAAAGVGGRAADAAHGASEVIAGVADYLRESDVRTLRADLARQVRERPVQTLLMAVGTGWLFGKIVR